MNETFDDETAVTPVIPRDASGDTPAAAPEQAPAQSSEHSRFQDLMKQQLQTLRQHAQTAVERVAEYLQRRRTSANESAKSDEVAKDLTTTLQDISLRQDSLESLLRESARDGVPTHTTATAFLDRENLPAWPTQFQSAVLDRLAGIETQLRTQNERRETTLAPTDQSAGNAELSLDIGEEEEDEDLTEQLDSPHVPRTESGPAWLHSLLGSELCADERLTESVNWLESSVLSNNADAQLLIGQLLVFRCASSDRKPPLLKEVGEAFYRCFPKVRDEPNLFEEVLAEWLRRQCVEAGLPNSIELVHPGERFDSTKHAPVERGGVEIVSVLGWIVLRDGGRIYSKAAVHTC